MIRLANYLLKRYERSCLKISQLLFLFFIVCRMITAPELRLAIQQSANNNTFLSVVVKYRHWLFVFKFLTKYCSLRTVIKFWLCINPRVLCVWMHAEFSPTLWQLVGASLKYRRARLNRSACDIGVTSCCQPREKLPHSAPPAPHFARRCRQRVYITWGFIVVLRTHIYLFLYKSTLFIVACLRPNSENKWTRYRIMVMPKPYINTFHQAI